MLLTICSLRFSPFSSSRSFGIFIQSSPSSDVVFPSPICSIHSANSATFCFCIGSSDKHFSRLFCVNSNISKCFHRYDLLIEAFTICSLLPLVITGRICLKSPPSITAIPPNGFSSLFSLVNLRISLRLLSSASKQCLFAIGASSHNISEVFFSSSAKCEPCFISHVESSVILSGIRNLECDVLPPWRSNAAMPHDATASTIFPSDLSFVVIAFHR
ncbi:hypothetical protein ACQJBY_022143 [Aegilops geniculata]